MRWSTGIWRPGCPGGVLPAGSLADAGQELGVQSWPGADGASSLRRLGFLSFFSF